MSLQKKRDQFRFSIRKEQIQTFKKKKRVQLINYNQQQKSKQKSKQNEQETQLASKKQQFNSYLQNSILLKQLNQKNKPSQQFYEKILQNPQLSQATIQWLQSFRQALAKQKAVLYTKHMNYFLTMLLKYEQGFYKNTQQRYKKKLINSQFNQNQIKIKEDIMKTKIIFLQSIAMIFYITEPSDLEYKIIQQVIEKIQINIYNEINGSNIMSSSSQLLIHYARYISERSFTCLRNIATNSSSQVINYLLQHTKVLEMLQEKLETPTTDKQKQDMLAIYLGCLVYMIKQKNIKKNSLKMNNQLKENQNQKEKESNQMELQQDNFYIKNDPYHIFIVRTIVQQNTKITCLAKCTDICYLLLQQFQTLNRQQKDLLKETIQQIFQSCNYYINPADLSLPDNYQDQDQVPQSGIQMLIQKYLQKYQNQMIDYEITETINIIKRLLQEKYIFQYGKKRRAIIRSSSYVVKASYGINKKDAGISQLAFQLMQQIFQILQSNQAKQQYQLLYFISNVLQNQQFLHNFVLKYQKNYKQKNYLDQILQFLKIISIQDPKVCKQYLVINQILAKNTVFGKKFDEIIQKIEGIYYGVDQQLSSYAGEILKLVQINKKNHGQYDI